MYVIISLNTVEGMIGDLYNGYSANLYLQSTTLMDMDRGYYQTFTVHVDEAMRFDTEAEAWELLKLIYKNRPDHTCAVLSIADHYMNRYEGYGHRDVQKWCDKIAADHTAKFERARRRCRRITRIPIRKG